MNDFSSNLISFLITYWYIKSRGRKMFQLFIQLVSQITYFAANTHISGCCGTSYLTSFRRFSENLSIGWRTGTKIELTSDPQFWLWLRRTSFNDWNILSRPLYDIISIERNRKLFVQVRRTFAAIYLPILSVRKNFIVFCIPFVFGGMLRVNRHLIFSPHTLFFPFEHEKFVS